MQANIDSLVEEAQKIRKNSYSPYSEYRVGCAILLEDGRIISGVNIENASYPVSLCAERAAMAQVVSLGLQDQIKALAVVTKSSPPGSPCGMCRQFLAEFLEASTIIYLGNEKNELIKSTMGELLPMAFKKTALQ
jgi:cytidine deaminase